MNEQTERKCSLLYLYHMETNKDKGSSNNAPTNILILESYTINALY